MSKIEEALEKANQIRTYTPEKDNKKPKIISKIELSRLNNPCLVTVNDLHSAVAEEFRRLKSLLIRETKSDFLNTVMISSSVANEGKSVIAANLAVSLANELDHSILLVDADLRRPILHEYFGVKYKYGLSDYLSEDMEVSDVLVKTDIDKLVLLPAGGIASNPVELLSSGKMQLLIKELKQRYMDRYIIIDTPPILFFSDALILASYVDGILFVVKEGQARKKAIEDALHIIKDSNVFGVVFNDVSVANLGRDYSSHYYKQKNNI